MNICIVSPDVVGPVRNGGVGTAFAGVAEALVGAGHDVTMLYASDRFEVGDEQHWRKHYAGLDISFRCLKMSATPKPTFQGSVAENYDILRSYYVYNTLRKANFDVVHFPDYLGVGFFSVMAKRVGLAFSNTIFCVTTHGPTMWSRPTNIGAIDSPIYLFRDALERGTVAHADHVVTPNRYMLDWLSENDWILPENRSVIPGVLPQGSVPLQPPAGVAYGMVDEFVFFGRLEPRKGIYIFLDAVDKLTALGASNTRPFKISFLGKFSDSPSFNKRILGLRARDWNLEWRVLDDLDTFQALDYLACDNRVAVLPSLCDNSPYALLECLSRGIPFLATDVGGIPELVAQEDWAGSLIQPRSADLANTMLRCLDQGHCPARPQTTVLEHARQWIALHTSFFEQRGHRGKDTIASPSIRKEGPTISVCLLHRDRPHYLQQALRGLRRQTLQDFEVIIADNGSTSAAALDFLRQQEATNSFPIRVIYLNENRFPSGGRNAAAAAARGQYLKFLDDDNVPKPRELDVFATALQTGTFDLVSCALDFFDDDNPPVDDDEADGRFLFLGDGGSASFLSNVQGDANFAVVRRKFEEIGGFDDDGFLYHAEDWRFFCKAKARGLSIGTIPDGLIWYRRDRHRARSNWRKGDTIGARYRAMEHLGAGLPTEIRNFLLFGQGAWFRGG